MRKSSDKRPDVAAESSPLHRAVCNRDVAEAGRLLRNGATADARLAHTEETALHLAVQSGCPEMVELLLAHGADPALRVPAEADGMTAWHLAAESDAAGSLATAVMEMLLSQARTDISTLWADDQMGGKADPLRLALAAGRTDIARQLLNFGAVVNTADENGCTPLHYLIAKGWSPGKFESLKMLLDRGADLDRSATNRGETALFLAVVNGWTEAVSLLLDHGCDPNRRNHQDETPLHRAARHYNPVLVEELLKAGADINVQNRTGATPLHIAAQHNRRETVKTLLEAGANPLLRDRRGFTPDHVCQGPPQVNTYALITRKQAEWREKMRVQQKNISGKTRFKNTPK